MATTKAELAEYTAKEVSAHQQVGDLWIIVHDEVFNISQYVNDHPGGADVFAEIAGADGSEAFDNAQHSEDALKLKAGMLVGRLKGDENENRRRTPKAVRLQAVNPSSSAPGKLRRILSWAISLLSIGTGVAIFGSGIWWGIARLRTVDIFDTITSVSASTYFTERKEMGFAEGMLFATAIFALSIYLAVRRFTATMKLWTGQWRYESHAKMPKIVRPELPDRSGWLHPGVYQKLALSKKELLAPDTFRFTFNLPKPDAVLGLPVGQHISIRGPVDGKPITRSYTPVSSNADRGVLELVVRCYEHGALTNGYLKGLQVGDRVEFRGPKGGLRYRRGLADKIGMVAGGTGITPMFQLIRAICEDPRDTTELSLIYASRSEQDILLRDELDTFARRYPRNLKLIYVLDQAPVNWLGGAGFVTRDMMEKRFAAPSSLTKVLVCGPPPMVESVKKGLNILGFKLPGVVSKPSDQVFCF